MPRLLGAVLICALAALGAPPARATVCTVGPFIIFFDGGSKTIDRRASEILDNVAAVHRSCGGKILLLGHSDKRGDAEANLRLSRLRAEGVRAHLISGRVPAALIELHAHGETRPLIETADGVAERQNRRVEIIFGPPDGW